MPSSETDPKPAQKPAEKPAGDTKEEGENVDRDGREHQPDQHNDYK